MKRQNGMQQFKYHVSHARKRAQQRFGMTVSAESLLMMVRLIREHKAMLLSRTSITRTTWAIQWRGELLPVVYSRAQKIIVTVLPPEAIDQMGRRADAEKFFRELAISGG